MQQKLLVIVGTTGAGKSKLAIQIAKALNGEVVNADAMQVGPNRLLPMLILVGQLTH